MKNSTEQCASIAMEGRSHSEFLHAFGNIAERTGRSKIEMRLNSNLGKSLLVDAIVWPTNSSVLQTKYYLQNSKQSERDKQELCLFFHSRPSGTLETGQIIDWNQTLSAEALRRHRLTASSKVGFRRIL